MTSIKVADDPEVFLAMEDLDLAGMGIADSVWYGSHRSNNSGPGVEFEAHRDYQRGDDVRRINWTLYARQRRLLTKESRRESRRPVHILVDTTGSMNVGNGRYSKFDYARRAAAAITFLAVRQGDLPSVGMLRDGLESPVVPGSGNLHALEICAALSRSKPDREGSIPDALIDSRTLCKKRGFIILISDFFDQETRIFSELSGYRAQGHDVLALQILDPFEVEIPEVGDFEFIDTETGSNLKTSVEPLRVSHAKTVAEWRKHLKQTAAANDIRWESVTTNDSLVDVTRRWLEIA